MTLDFSDYQPNMAVLEALRQVSLIGVVGPTAVGKSTLVKKAKELESSLHIVLSTVSRLPRPGEQDGVDYHFRSRDEMLAKIEQRAFVQVPPSLLGDLYATAPEDYAAQGTSVLALLAETVPTLRALPFRENRTVFVLPPDYEAWQERVAHHNFTPEQLQKRLAEAVQSLDFACNSHDILFILNDDLAVAAEEFVDIVHGKLPPLAQQEACRKLAQTLQERLQASLLNASAALAVQ
jgi:guanylate kinase